MPIWPEPVRHQAIVWAADFRPDARYRAFANPKAARPQVEVKSPNGPLIGLLPHVTGSIDMRSRWRTCSPMGRVYAHQLTRRTIVEHRGVSYSALWFWNPRF